MNVNFITAITIITAFMFTGCSRNMVNNVKNTTPKDSVRIIRLSPIESKICSSANGFAWQVFGYSSAKNGNRCLTVSPLSIIYALGIINNGAGGNTTRQICKTMGFTCTTDSINAFCNKIISEFACIDSTTTMNIANAVILNERLKIKDSFISVIKNNYDAMIDVCNFNKKSIVNNVNEWCIEKTDGMISNMIDDISPDDAAIIVNAIYFRGLWKNKFYKDDTKKDKFKAADGTVKDVDMMQKAQMEKYTENEIFSAVSMLYGNGHYSMQIILPQKGKSISDAAEAMKKVEWKSFTGNMKPMKVNVIMPRFSIEHGQDLTAMLTDLGAGDMFSRKKADMSKLCHGKAWISSLMHKTKIEVNEEGTRAAAATGTVTIGAFDIEKAEAVEFKADHPFIFVITERNTGMICFIGQYTGN